MPSTYAQNKQHIYKYREQHLDEYRAIVRKAKQKYDNWKKVQKIYLRILL
jgi:hypothetical protein